MSDRSLEHINFLCGVLGTSGIHFASCVILPVCHELEGSTSNQSKVINMLTKLRIMVTAYSSRAMPDSDVR